MWILGLKGLMEGTLRSDDSNGNGNENVRKSKRFYNQNNNSARAAHFL